MKDWIVPAFVLLIVIGGAPPIGIALAVIAAVLMFLGRKS